MLCVVGDLVEDVVVHLSGPAARGTDTPSAILRRRGGSAASVAVAAADAGCRTRFIGRVGDDELGRQLIDALGDADVDARVQVCAGRTGSIVVLVDADGERTMLSDRAAAVDLADVDQSWLDGVTALHVPAYSLCAEPIGTTSQALVRHVRSTWGRISVDVSSTAVVESYGVGAFADLLRALAPDIVFANDEEAELARDVGVALLVVKHGPEPVELVHAGGRVEHVPVEAVRHVGDTTGAGDALAGAFLAAVLRGSDPRQAAAAGIGAAGARLRALAAPHGMPR